MTTMLSSVVYYCHKCATYCCSLQQPVFWGREQTAETHITCHFSVKTGTIKPISQINIWGRHPQPSAF